MIWVTAFVFCPPAAVVGAIVVALQTQDLVIAVVAGGSGLAVGLLATAVVNLLSGVIAAIGWAMETVVERVLAVFMSPPRSGQGLIKSRKYRVLDRVEMVVFGVFFLPLVFVAFLGPAVAALAATIVVGFHLGG